MKNTSAFGVGTVTLLTGSMATANAQDIPQTKTDTTKTLTEKTTKDLRTTVGFNAIETAITNKGDARIRTYAEMGLAYKTLEVGVCGMNEFTGNLKTYFGRNVALAGIKDSKLKLIGVMKTGPDGITDDKYGLRYLISDKLGVDYGRVDISANQHGGDATFFLGKTIGKNGSIEAFESVDIDFKGKVSPYTEIQLNKEVLGGLNVFVRGEMAGIEYKNIGYLFGVSKTLK